MTAIASPCCDYGNKRSHRLSSLYPKLIDFNNLHKNLQFSMEKENKNTTNFLDLTIHRGNQVHAQKALQQATEQESAPAAHRTPSNPPQFVCTVFIF
jgi:hypothetical protein